MGPKAAKATEHLTSKQVIVGSSPIARSTVSYLKSPLMISQRAFSFAKSYGIAVERRRLNGKRLFQLSRSVDISGNMAS
jgi:hypothetical protein